MSLATPAAENSAPATILMEHIPREQRTNMMMSMIQSLQFGDHFGIELVASLLVQEHSPGPEQDFLNFLERAIRNGNVQVAVSIGLKFPVFGTQLLQKTADAMAKAKSIREGKRDGDDSLHSYLLFSKPTICHLPIVQAQSAIFEACLDLLSRESKQISNLSKDVVFTVLSTADNTILTNVVLPRQSILWACIKKLVVSCDNKIYSLLGYSVWLRWIIPVAISSMDGFITDEYWELLIDGLRRNDSEQRKLCLNILKLTMAADSTAVPRDTYAQYHRYCTVFETVLLGRYINQIQECENDLNLLAKDNAIQPKWLYLLLASALDNHMQDSNRKFIGNWVMQSGLQPSSEFMGFFETDFLPWAIQGRLFVASLRMLHGQLRCIHGDRLSRFIRRLRKDSSEPARLAEIIVEMILQKQHSLFAYATVYLLEGLKGTLLPDQKERISQLMRLPGVARDFVTIQTDKPIRKDVDKSFTSKRELLEQQAIEKCSVSKPDTDTLDSIWQDLEYLEHPKRLLLVMPNLVFHPMLVRRALEEPSFKADLALKLEILLTIANTKTFLFAPLVTGLWNIMVANPKASEVFKISEFVQRIVEHPPEPTIDLMLEESTIHLTPFTYEHYFGERRSYGFAALLDIVSRLQDNQDVVHEILNRLLQPWKDQKLPPPTVSTWKRTLQLQVLLLCFEQFTPNSEGEIQNLLEDLFHILAAEPLPRYRYLLEWIIVRLFVKHDLMSVLFDRLATKDHHSNPKYLASLMKIGTILTCRKNSEEQLALRLATTFVPLAASSKVIIRHEAQWQFPLLMDYARSKCWKSFTENSTFLSLDDYIRSLERFHDPPLERQVGRFNPEKDHTLSNLVEGSWFNLDQIEMPLTSRAEFVKLYNGRSNFNLPDPCMPLGDKIDHRAALVNTAEDSINTVALGPKTFHEASALQTKGTAYLARTLFDASLHQSRSRDVIVIASLVENPYNLGGLSRVSEIFGASALCLQNQNVLTNKDFTSVSVSSHLHLPIVQLSASSIPQYLADRKSEDFTIVGIEQTDRSVVLGSKDAHIPRRVVLVVGSEKEGIPALVLTECDLLVEIPQQGITRSLNVQTAVSIVLYEHSRQNGKV